MSPDLNDQRFENGFGPAVMVMIRGRGGPAGGKLVMSGRRLAARLDFRSGPARWVRMARRIWVWRSGPGRVSLSAVVDPWPTRTQTRRVSSWAMRLSHSVWSVRQGWQHWSSKQACSWLGCGKARTRTLASRQVPKSELYLLVTTHLNDCWLTQVETDSIPGQTPVSGPTWKASVTRNSSSRYRLAELPPPAPQQPRPPCLARLICRSVLVQFVATAVMISSVFHNFQLFWIPLPIMLIFVPRCQNDPWNS